MTSTFTTNKGFEKQGTGDNENTWGAELNAVLDMVDKAVAGSLSKSVAGSTDVTLTATEALNIRHEYTGALTGNINVIVPAASAPYFIYNNTSGSFTLTVKTPSGTGIEVPQGQKLLLFCDGVNVEDAFSGVAAAFRLFGQISPSQITANQNDYSPTGLSTAAALRLDSDATRNITGIAGGSRGRILLLHNIGSFAIVLKNADTGSTAANRFAMAADFILLAGQSVAIWYDSVSSRWRVLAYQAGADVTPSQITADQNDYAPSSLGSAAALRLSSDAARNITGLTGGIPGRLLVLHNVGSFAITLKDESSSSTAANRFALSSDIAVGTDQSVLLRYDGTSSRWRAVAWPTASTSIPGRNVLINGAFAINQRAPATNADDTYAHDRWYALTQTGAIALSTVAAAEDGLPFMARLTQSQASAQRMGYAQIIEGKNCRHLRGQQVTFRFSRFRCSASQAIRFAVLEWTGTEDSVTSDVVNDWTSGTYTAGNFFLGSNLTVSGVAAQTPSADTLTTMADLTVTLGSSFNNLIVFAWTEGTAAQNITLDLGKAQLEKGAASTEFEQRPFGLELILCQRYYEKSFDLATAPAQNVGTSKGETQFGAQQAGAAANKGQLSYKVEKRSAPTVTLYNPSAANAEVRDIAVSGDCSSSQAQLGHTKGFLIACTGNGSTAIGNALGINWAADAEL